jgi:hypothetical protein
MTKSKTDLVELMRADRLVQIKRQVDQAAVDLRGRRGNSPRGQDRASIGTPSRGWWRVGARLVRRISEDDLSAEAERIPSSQSSRLLNT